MVNLKASPEGEGFRPIFWDIKLDPVNGSKNIDGPHCATGRLVVGRRNVLRTVRQNHFARTTGRRSRCDTLRPMSNGNRTRRTGWRSTILPPLWRNHEIKTRFAKRHHPLRTRLPELPPTLMQHRKDLFFYPSDVTDLRRCFFWNPIILKDLRWFLCDFLAILAFIFPKYLQMDWHPPIMTAYRHGLCCGVISMWCRFLRPFFRHHNIGGTCYECQSDVF